MAYDVVAISDRWLVQGATTAVMVIFWLAAGLGVGMLGDRYRAQVARSLRRTARETP